MFKFLQIIVVAELAHLGKLKTLNQKVSGLNSVRNQWGKPMFLRCWTRHFINGLSRIMDTFRSLAYEYGILKDLIAALESDT